VKFYDDVNGFMSLLDSVMGLTFLAAGTSVPEAVSSVIVTAAGHGSMGISNSIGSNTFDILLCLGLPWLIKTLIAPTISGQPWVSYEFVFYEKFAKVLSFQITLQSTGITYSTVSLLTTLFALYCSFITNKFMLDKKIGISCLTFYVLFLVFALLVELNVLFPVATRISIY
jgi:solute carrier family 24 (sodium/potassium/calcium exchanger), member 4